MTGERFNIYRTEDGIYYCPVCGSGGLKSPPYYENGSPSFEMCECGFEFGYDDSPFVTRGAVEGIKENWTRWRKKLIHEASADSKRLSALEAQLKNINIKLTFDLIDVEEENKD